MGKGADGMDTHWKLWLGRRIDRIKKQNNYYHVRKQPLKKIFRFHNREGQEREKGQDRQSMTETHTETVFASNNYWLTEGFWAIQTWWSTLDPHNCMYLHKHVDAHKRFSTKTFHHDPCWGPDVVFNLTHSLQTQLPLDRFHSGELVTQQSKKTWTFMEDNSGG